MKDRRDYFGDVMYETWMRGGNVDNVDADRVDDSRARGYTEEDATNRELFAQRRYTYPVDREEEE